MLYPLSNSTTHAGKVADQKLKIIIASSLTPKMPVGFYTYVNSEPRLKVSFKKSDPQSGVNMLSIFINFFTEGLFLLQINLITRKRLFG